MSFANAALFVGRGGRHPEASAEAPQVHAMIRPSLPRAERGSLSHTSALISRDAKRRKRAWSALVKAACNGNWSRAVLGIHLAEKCDLPDMTRLRGAQVRDICLRGPWWGGAEGCPLLHQPASTVE